MQSHAHVEFGVYTRSVDKTGTDTKERKKSVKQTRFMVVLIDTRGEGKTEGEWHIHICIYAYVYIHAYIYVYI